MFWRPHVRFQSRACAARMTVMKADGALRWSLAGQKPGDQLGGTKKRIRLSRRHNKCEKALARGRSRSDQIGETAQTRRDGNQ